jgi:hypothetical protein
MRPTPPASDKPPVNHLAKPRTATIVPSVAVNGGIAVKAI